MRRFVALVLIGMLALLGVSQARAQVVSPKARILAQQSATLSFETVQDGVAAMPHANILVARADHAERFQVLWVLGEPVLMKDNVPVSFGQAYDHGSYIDVYFELSDDPLYNEGLIITFSLDTSGHVVALASDIHNQNSLRQTILVNSRTGAISTDEASCRCIGGGNDTVKGPCTSTQCDDAGTECQTSGAAAYCAWMQVRVEW
jgi:hypothetical protein